MQLRANPLDNVYFSAKVLGVIFYDILNKWATLEFSSKRNDCLSLTVMSSYRLLSSEAK